MKYFCFLIVFLSVIHDAYTVHCRDCRAFDDEPFGIVQTPHVRVILNSSKPDFLSLKYTIIMDIEDRLSLKKNHYPSFAWLAEERPQILKELRSVHKATYQACTEWLSYYERTEKTPYIKKEEPLLKFHDNKKGAHLLAKSNIALTNSVGISKDLTEGRYRLCNPNLERDLVMLYVPKKSHIDHVMQLYNPQSACMKALLRWKADSIAERCFNKLEQRNIKFKPSKHMWQYLSPPTSPVAIPQSKPCGVAHPLSNAAK